jgi:hypothetical protein
MCQSADADRDRSRSTATGATWRHSFVPRIKRRTVKRIIREPSQRELRRIRTPYDDGAGASPIRDNGAVLLCDDIAECGNAVRGGAASLIGVAFDRYRNAMQRTGLETGIAKRLVGRDRVGARTIAIDIHDGIDDGIYFFQSVKRGVDSLDAGNASVSNQASNFHGIEAPKVLH